MSDIHLHPWQAAVVKNPFTHYAFFGGVAVGKTFTGSHFALENIDTMPDESGLIGANTYNQLSQATLREFFYWLDYYGYKWVADKRPPRHWGGRREFKSYANIISVKAKNRLVTIFTRVMSKPNPLRGIEFSWYWMDEVRDTPQNTHDVIVSRLRESKKIRGLVTSTTNGEDWSYERFIVKNPKDLTYGFTHVATIEAVKAGIITQEFYDQLLKTYSKVTAAQELDAKHVNIAEHPVYYAYGDHNVRDTSPLTRDGGIHPALPIIVAMDFNLTPMCWTLGQNAGPNWYWHDEIHLEHSHTPEAALELVERVKGHPAGIVICGDATSNAGQRAAAGQSDYDIVGQILDANSIRWTSRTPSCNPTVKDRVNAVNAVLRSASGQVSMWHSPKCRNLQRDLSQVAWKKGATLILDSGPKGDMTHASDGIGYAICEITPIQSAVKPGKMFIIRR
jgi:hypothetical protein